MCGSTCFGTAMTPLLFGVDMGDSTVYKSAREYTHTHTTAHTINMRAIQKRRIDLERRVNQEKELSMQYNRLPETRKEVEYRKIMRELLEAYAKELNNIPECAYEDYVKGLELVRRGRKLLGDK